MKKTDNRKTKWPFSWSIANHLLDEISEGNRLTLLCGNGIFPSYNIICRWRRENPEFNDSLVFAYEDRNENIRQKIFLLKGNAIVSNSRKRRFREVEKELSRQIGLRYPKRLSPKSDRRRTRLIIDTGINRVLWMHKS
jgi:hypothetical protein